MADSITDDASLIDTGLITPFLKQSLTPAEWCDDTDAAGPWDRWHRQAWAEMLLNYAARPTPILEADIDDTSVLKPIAHFYVLYLAYFNAGQHDLADRYFARYKELLNEIVPTVDGGDAIGWGYGINMERGG